MIIFKRGLGLAFLLGTFSILSGCGGSDSGDTVAIKGKLLDNGNPLVVDQSKFPLPAGATAPPPGSGLLRIVFIPIDAKEQFLAKYNQQNGTFEVLGPSGKGIKPGMYKIAITASYTPGSKDNNDYFQGKFSPENTKIVREVKPGEEIVIDVAK